MDRYLKESDVNAMLKQICDDTATTYGVEHGGRAEKFARLTENIPAANVEEIKHGEWLPITSPGLYGWKCSLCDEHVYVNRKADVNRYLYPRCPMCGAKMKKGE